MAITIVSYTTNQGWKISKNNLDYFYSSSRYYEKGTDEFGFLHNLYNTSFQFVLNNIRTPWFVAHETQCFIYFWYLN